MNLPSLLSSFLGILCLFLLLQPLFLLGLLDLFPQGPNLTLNLTQLLRKLRVFPFGNLNFFVELILL